MSDDVLEPAPGGCFQVVVAIVVVIVLINGICCAVARSEAPMRHAAGGAR